MQGFAYVLLEIRGAMQKTIVNGIELAYARCGHGQPLVLLHGYPLDHHIWDAITPLLEDKFDLLIPDLRGFGESATVETPYTMDDYASDIAALLDSLRITKTAIAGHSMGGYVALAFARLFPDRVTGLGLIASQTLADSPERKEGRYKSAAEAAEQGIGGIVEAMTPKFTSDSNLQAFVRQVMQRQTPQACIGALKAMAERPDSTSVLASLTCPIVLVHGDADLLIPVERAREAKEAAPHALLVELPGAGHLPMLEAKEQTAQTLAALYTGA
jgi:pimeloyl-ACP methyl ester carboxylesterase